MLCCRCKKRPAVVFVATNAESDSQGYCLTCAKELGIKPVTDIMQKMGISDEDLDAVQEQMDTIMEMSENGEIPNFAEMMGQELPDGEDSEGEEDGFTPGGAPTFPLFKNFFPGQKQGEEKPGAAKQPGANEKRKKEEKKQKRKHIEMYCSDLTRRAREGR